MRYELYLRIVEKHFGGIDTNDVYAASRLPQSTDGVLKMNREERYDDESTDGLDHSLACVYALSYMLRNKELILLRLL